LKFAGEKRNKGIFSHINDRKNLYLDVMFTTAKATKTTYDKD